MSIPAVGVLTTPRQSDFIRSSTCLNDGGIHATRAYITVLVWSSKAKIGRLEAVPGQIGGFVVWRSP